MESRSRASSDFKAICLSRSRRSSRLKKISVFAALTLGGRMDAQVVENVVALVFLPVHQERPVSGVTARCSNSFGSCGGV